MLQLWQGQGLGRALIQAEAQLLSTIFDDVFGLELLQLGAWGTGRELLEPARIRRQSVVADPGQRGTGADLVASLSHLPISNASVDAVLLPHTLEVAGDPYAVLREADRVLVAEGQLILLGFRPMGLWGLRATVSRAGFPPGLRRMLSASRVRDWLGLLSYEILSVTPYLYRLPRSVDAADVDTAVHGLQRRRWFYPWPAGAYLIKARKRVYTVTPIRHRPREKLRVLSGLAHTR
jgi:SAM-dependent methyltransferase